jgi:hypothetical protein
MKALTPNSKGYKKLQSNIYGNVSRFFDIVVASILTDKLGFNEAKTKAVLSQIEERADSILKGYMTLEDLEKTLKEEYNITFAKERR